MRSLPLFILAPSILALACGGKANPPGAMMPRMPMMPMMPAMPADDGKPHVDLVSSTYTLQPAEEKYFCYTMNMPKDADIVITKISPTYGQGTHHILVSQTLIPEPDGFSECNVLVRTTWLPIYAGGKDSGPLALPDNTGFKLLVRGQQVLMQLHLLNATRSPISDTTAIRIEYAPATPSIVQAGIFGVDNRKLSLPAHTITKSSMSCVLDRPLDVFAVLGHMHKLGRHLRLSKGMAADENVMFDKDWSFDTQPITPVSLQLAMGDDVFLECTHDNVTDQPVAWGESTNTEMCAMVFYYVPYAGLDGCVQQ